MSRGIFRLVLLALVAGSVVLQFRGIRIRDDLLQRFDMTRALEQVLTEAGIETLPNPVDPRRVMAAAVLFKRAGCADKSWAVPFSFNIDTEALVVRTNIADPVVSHHYLGLAGEQPDRVRMYQAWLWQSLRTQFGARDYVPVKTGLLVVEPRGCADNAMPDWRQVWDRRYLGDPKAIPAQGE